MKRIFLISLACLLWSSALPAQTPFYQGKTVRVVVGFSPGGAFDLWARLIATHMGKYIPGNPTFIVQNMTGGGSMVAANYVYSVAKPDGLTLGSVSPTLYIEQLAGRKEVQYDWPKFSWIGSPEKTERIFYIRSDTPYKTLEDMQTAGDPPKCGSTGLGTAAHFFPRFLEEAFGSKVNIVIGYPGSADVNLAIERGEVHCFSASLQAFFGSEPGRTWARTGFARVLVQGGKKRDPRLPDVPTVWELMDKHKSSEVVRRLARVFLAPDDLGRPLFGTPGIPADRVKVLREAFMKTMNDPELLAEAQKKRLDPSPIGGDDLEVLTKELVNLPPEVIQQMKKLLEK